MVPLPPLHPLETLTFTVADFSVLPEDTWICPLLEFTEEYADASMDTWICGEKEVFPLVW
jgi:hypothetical protein